MTFQLDRFGLQILRRRIQCHRIAVGKLSNTGMQFPQSSCATVMDGPNELAGFFAMAVMVAFHYMYTVSDAEGYSETCVRAFDLEWRRWG